MTVPFPRTTGLSAKPAAENPQMQVLESALHDATNGIAAARSYGEILLLREKNKTDGNSPLIESLLKELERAGEILRNVRSGVIETYQPGDVLMCKTCGYSFVHRKAAGKMASCRRCKSYEVTRWKP